MCSLSYDVYIVSLFEDSQAFKLVSSNEMTKRCRGLDTVFVNMFLHNT